MEFKSHLLDRSGLNDVTLERKALAHIAAVLARHALTMADVGLESIDESELLDAMNEEFPAPSLNVRDDYNKLNDEQRWVTDAVIKAAQTPPSVAYASGNKPSSPRQFFLQGSGGTGKTFIYNVIIRTCLEKGLSVMAVASTGIAAVLLDGGQTVHSAFKLSLDLAVRPHLSQQSVTARIIRNAKAIVWDEAPMQHHNVLRNVDELLREVMNCDYPFGGKVMLLGGDFKQLLPVIRSRLPMACYSASLLSSDLFTKNFKMFTLTKNVRAQEDPEYAAWLDEIGTGSTAVKGIMSGTVYVALYPGLSVYTENEAIDFVYPVKHFNPNDRSYDLSVRDCAILTSRNVDVDRLNNAIMTTKLKGEFHVYEAVNEPVNTKNAADEYFRDCRMPEELATFEAADLPPQKLRLKEGAVVMLTRNLDIKTGLCNGTRMIVKKFLKELIICQVLTGSAAGTTCGIFRIRHLHNEPLDDRWPPFNRIQFPLRPAFAMTINKAQGQTLSKVGVVLSTPIFAHGQLYVALSRVRSSQNIKVYVPVKNRKLYHKQHVGITVNVVFQQVLVAMNKLITPHKYHSVFLNNKVNIT